LSNVPANIAVAILRDRQLSLSYEGQVVGGALGVMELIGGAEEITAIQQKKSNMIGKEVMKKLFRCT
jgi:hypothetical protein